MALPKSFPFGERGSFHSSSRAEETTNFFELTRLQLCVHGTVWPAHTICSLNYDTLSSENVIKPSNCHIMKTVIGRLVVSTCFCVPRRQCALDLFASVSAFSRAERLTACVEEWLHSKWTSPTFTFPTHSSSHKGGRSELWHTFWSSSTGAIEEVGTVASDTSQLNEYE